MPSSILTRIFPLARNNPFISSLIFLAAIPIVINGQFKIRYKETSPIRRPDLRPLGQIIEHNETSITFLACMKSPELTNELDWQKGQSSSLHVVQFSSEFERKKQTLLQGSEMPASILPSQGFVHSVVAAYKDHHNLLLTPDDIWIAILVQFSLYVNANAEELRHHFVTHNGTKQLDISVGSEDSSIHTINWTQALKDLESILESNTNPKMSQFVTNNFTTTTETTRIASTLVFMSTLQKYFTYDFGITCGIPRITILGTVGDWEEIAKRVEFLKTFGPIPTQWSEMLYPIIEQFIKAKQGNVDADFWGNMVKVRREVDCAGSGINLDGWITTFALFDRNGNFYWQADQPVLLKWPRLEMDEVASGVVSVPITINGRTNGTILVGHMGHGVLSDKTTFAPYVGWAVATVDDENDKKGGSKSPVFPYFYQK